MDDLVSPWWSGDEEKSQPLPWGDVPDDYTASAGVLLGKMESGEMPRGHVDLALLRCLKADEGVQKDVVSATSAPHGNFLGHPSGCDPKLYGAYRPAKWTEDWCCPGNRVEQDPQARKKWLCGLTNKGGAEWKKETMDQRWSLSRVHVEPWTTYWCVKEEKEEGEEKRR